MTRPAGLVARPAACLLAAMSIVASLQQPIDGARPQTRTAPPAARAVQPAVSALAAGLPQLTRDLDALVGAPTVDRATWGVVARSLVGNDTLYSMNGSRLFLPASNMKIVTLAAAADLLGWDYTFETRLVAAGAVDAGVLKGDLVVVGSGDPSIDDWDGAATVLFKSWADMLRASGIRTITGRIVGDDDSFDDEALGSGWAWDDLDRSFATGIGALQFNENTAQITVTAGTRAGSAPTASVGPAGSGLLIRNLLTTGVPRSAAALTVRRRTDSPTIELHGSLPAGGGPVVRNVAVINPTAYFVTQLRDGLIKSGVDVLGQAVDIDDIGDPPSRARGTVVVTHRSPPLATLAVTMMRLSQNLYAETLLKTMGARNAVGSVESGRKAVTAKLQEWGLALSDFRLADGSGLSPYDAITPDVLASILAHVANDPRLRDPFQASLPIAGREGTLAARMKGTLAEGNAKAKTGSLSNVHAVSGYVQSAEGEPLVFSIIVNNFGAASEAAQQTIDGIIVRLAQFRRRPGP